ncbi:MAG: ABC transporter substrate binding protein [Treponema sp.]
MKKTFVAAVCLATAVLTAGCQKKSDGKLKIGVIQLVEHPALDVSYKGFTDGLKEAGFIDGENITIDYHNAQGEQINCVTIAEKLVNDNDDLILAITTPAAQAVANLTNKIPILVTAVTDPESAKLVNKNEMPGTNVSGTSDLTPCAAQIELIKKIVPDVRTIGLLYCSSEQNSHFQIAIAKQKCDELGIKYVEGTVSNTNELQQVTQSLCGKTDAIYAPTDNMIAAGMATVAQVALENKKIVVPGAIEMVASGGLATYGIDYYTLGKQTAEMAVEILKNGKNPAEMPVQYQQTFRLSVNDETAAALGIDTAALENN